MGGGAGESKWGGGGAGKVVAAIYIQYTQVLSVNLPWPFDYVRMYTGT